MPLWKGRLLLRPSVPRNIMALFPLKRGHLDPRRRRGSPPLQLPSRLYSSWLPIQSLSVPELRASQSKATGSSRKELWHSEDCHGIDSSTEAVTGDLVHRECIEGGLQDDKVTPVIWSSWTRRPKAGAAGFSDPSTHRAALMRCQPAAQCPPGAASAPQPGEIQQQQRQPAPRKVTLKDDSSTVLGATVSKTTIQSRVSAETTLTKDENLRNKISVSPRPRHTY